MVSIKKIIIIIQKNITHKNKSHIKKDKLLGHHN